MRQALERARQRHETIDAALAEVDRRDRQRRVARLTRLLAARRFACPRCGYDLDGLRSDRCPECGEDLLNIFVPRPISLRDDLLNPGGMAAALNLLVAAAGLALVLLHPALRLGPVWPASTLIATGGAVSVAVVATCWARSVFTGQSLKPYAAAMLGAAIISASLIGAAMLFA
jgi:hypothetical protein